MADRQDPNGRRQGKAASAQPAGHSPFRPHWWLAVLLSGVAAAGITAAFVMTPGGTTVSSSLRSVGSAGSSSAPQPGLAATSIPSASTPSAGTHGPANSTRHAPVRPPAPAVRVTPLPPGVKASLHGWAAGHGGTALALVSQQLGVSAQAAGLRLYVTMKQACTQLGTAVTAASAGPPIPDAAMQDQYTRALAELATAAADCRAGISARAHDESVTTSVNQALLERARAELTTGARELYAATSRIKLTSGSR